MQDLQQLVFRLCAAPGLPGDEHCAAQAAKEELSKYGDVSIDAMGNVIAKLGNQNANTQLMLDAHLDQIGLVVTGITDYGFLNIANCGGVDRRVLPGSHVTVYGKEILHGIVCCLPPHLVEGGSEKIVPIDKMAVDVGLSEEKAKELIRLGDPIIVSGEPRALISSRITSAALDDRAGVAALIRCVELLNDTKLNCGLTILLSGREETGEQGAKTGAYTVDPTEAIMVDVSFADQPQVPESKCGRLSKGPMIGVSPSLNTAMTQKLIAIAKDKDIPCQFEVMGGETGTNADQVGTTREGVRTALLSIPLRYMHTPVEVIDLADVEHTAKLLAEYIKGVQ